MSFSKNYKIDLRSLSLFRILLSLIVLYDFLFTRLPHFSFFYSKDGFFPSHLTLNDYWSFFPSINFLSENYYYQLFLILLTVFFALLVLIGFKTKFSTLILWFLFSSFGAKNYLILNAGDQLLNLLLLWSIFLPLGAYFSVDKRRIQFKDYEFFSPVNIFILLQVLFVYMVNFWLKLGGSWEEGFALIHALNLDEFRKPFGDFLTLYPSFLKILNFVILYFIEGLIPFLILFFYKNHFIRIFCIFVMCFFHLSIHFSLMLGTFPFICIASWILFLPSSFWEKFKKIKIFKFKETLVSFKHHLSGFEKLIASVFFVLILFWNFSYNIFYDYNLGFDISKFMHTLRLRQSWSMFAPSPPKANLHYVLKGRKQGEEKLIFEYKRYKDFPNFRFRKLTRSLLFMRDENSKKIKSYLSYYCNKGDFDSVEILMIKKSFYKRNEKEEINQKRSFFEKC